MSAGRLARLNAIAADRMRDGAREAARCSRTLESQSQLIAHLRRSQPVSTDAERAAVAEYEPLGSTYPCTRCGRFAFARAGVRCWWCGRTPTELRSGR